MAKLTPRITEQEIQTRITELGRQIAIDYKDKDLVVIGILKGSFIFLADLIRQIPIDLDVDFMGASSYEGQESTGQITFTKQPDLKLKNRDILLVEDIIDTGKTLMKIAEFINLLNPRSLKICALINKEERRQMHIEVAYYGFLIKEGFIVGYGLDYDEKYRNLPGIHDLEI